MGEFWYISEAPRFGRFGVFVNGYVEHPFGMPGVNCPSCTTWSSVKTLPIECPLEIRKEVEAVCSKECCIPWRKFRRYADRWEVVLRQQGHRVCLQPGDDLWPSVWQIPARPKYHFYWCLRETVVSALIRDLITRHSITGVAIASVIIKAAGTLDPDEPIPEAIMRKFTDEMDLLDLCPQVIAPEVYGRFYSMIPLNDSYDLFIAMHNEKFSVCEVCGYRKLVPAYEEQEMERNKVYRDHAILPACYSFPVDIFRSHIFTDGIVVSDRFFHLLGDQQLQNCDVRELTVVSDERGMTECENKVASSTVLLTDEIVEEEAAQDRCHPGCIVAATADVGEFHKPIRVMLRTQLDIDERGYGLGEGQVSGWIFSSGEEDGDSGSISMYFLKDIIQHDSSIVPYLSAQPPCRLERDDDLPLFYEVTDDDEV